MKKRLFTAINLPDSLKKELTGIQRSQEIIQILETTQGRFTKSENLHITVSFLDTIEENLVTGLIDIVNHVCNNNQPFKLALKEIAFGPPGKLARMIWATFDSSENYNKLRSELNQKIADFLKHKKQSIYLDSHKEPTIHVTLARLHQYIKPFPIVNTAIRSMEFNCRAISLLESKLSPQGAIYTELAKCNFKT